MGTEILDDLHTQRNTIQRARERVWCVVFFNLQWIHLHCLCVGDKGKWLLETPMISAGHWCCTENKIKDHYIIRCSCLPPKLYYAVTEAVGW